MLWHVRDITKNVLPLLSRHKYPINLSIQTQEIPFGRQYDRKRTKPSPIRLKEVFSGFLLRSRSYRARPSSIPILHDPQFAQPVVPVSFTALWQTWPVKAALLQHVQSMLLPGMGLLASLSVKLLTPPMTHQLLLRFQSKCPILRLLYLATTSHYCQNSWKHATDRLIQAFEFTASNKFIFANPFLY